VQFTRYVNFTACRVLRCPFTSCYCAGNLIFLVWRMEAGISVSNCT